VFGEHGHPRPMQDLEPKPIAFEGDEPATDGEPRGQPVTTQVTVATRAPAPLQDPAERRPGLALDAYPLGGLPRRPCPGDADGREGTIRALSSPLSLPKLTEKQARALLAAFTAGYYEFPRNVTTEDVSLSLGIARSTFEQHLTRAEHHVIRAMLPMVRMRSGRPHAEALEVYSKFSRELGLYVQLEVLGDRVAAVSLAKKASPASIGEDHPYLARILEHIHTGKG